MLVDLRSSIMVHGVLYARTTSVIMKQSLPADHLALRECYNPMIAYYSATAHMRNVSSLSRDAMPSFTANLDEQYPAADGPVWLDRGLECQGFENHLALCEHGGWGRSNCDYTHDVILSCRHALGMCLQSFRWLRIYFFEKLT